jgi:hypothetical protein
MMAAALLMYALTSTCQTATTGCIYIVAINDQQFPGHTSADCAIEAPKD